LQRDSFLKWFVSLRTMLPLMTAVIGTDEYDSEDTFRTAFMSSGRNHSRDPRLAEFMNNLTFEFSGFFTTEDIRILLQVEMWQYREVTDEEMEADRRALRTLRRRSFVPLISHTRAILKAIDFHELFYKDKLDEWISKISAAYAARRLRARTRLGPITGEETSDDEGYDSDDASDLDYDSDY
jgi:hypothetical protein